MEIRVVEAGPEEMPVVQNLVHFYVYDTSGIMGWDCPETGLFDGCDDLCQYWGEEPVDPRHRWPEGWVGYPFLLRVDGRIAGFALIRRLETGLPPLHEVGQFFILQRYRRKGVGRHVALELFRRFPGRWVVRELEGNKPAQAFWRAVIREHTGGNCEETIEPPDPFGFRMVAQRFVSPEIDRAAE